MRAQSRSLARVGTLAAMLATISCSGNQSASRDGGDDSAVAGQQGASGAGGARGGAGAGGAAGTLGRGGGDGGGSGGGTSGTGGNAGTGLGGGGAAGHVGGNGGNAGAGGGSSGGGGTAGHAGAGGGGGLGGGVAGSGGRGNAGTTGAGGAAGGGAGGQAEVFYSCPPSAPVANTPCPGQTFPDTCYYEDCKGAGITLASCSGGVAWTTSGGPCGDFNCASVMTCSSGTFCHVVEAGGITNISCDPIPSACGTGPLICDCLRSPTDPPCCPPHNAANPRCCNTLGNEMICVACIVPDPGCT